MTVLRSRSRQAGEHSEAQSLSAVLSDRAGPDDGKMRLGAFELWGRQAARPRLQMQVCGAAPGEFVKFRAAEPTLGVASGEPWPASGRSVQAVQDVDGPSHHGERMSVLRRNNVRVLGGSGPIIVYAHGFGCSSRMWERITPAFAATHRQVLFDFVGSGGSDTSAFDVARYSTLQGYAQDLIEVLDTLSLDGDVTFIGHSLSASIGLLASIVRPALFDRLILLGPSPCFLNGANGSRVRVSALTVKARKESSSVKSTGATSKNLTGSGLAAPVKSRVSWPVTICVEVRVTESGLKT